MNDNKEANNISKSTIFFINKYIKLKEKGNKIKIKTLQRKENIFKRKLNENIKNGIYGTSLV